MKFGIYAPLLTEVEHLLAADYCMAAHSAGPEVLIQDPATHTAVNGGGD
jgi:hypothetical protein